MQFKQVLDFEYFFDEQVKTQLIYEFKNEIDSYTSVVLSSKNGTVALEILLNELSKELKNQWACKNWFIVGEKSKSKLTKYWDSQSISSNTINCANNADDLSNLIVQQIETENSKHRKILILAGDKALPNIPEKLSKSRIPFVKFVVYRSNLLRQNLNQVDGLQNAWICFFSPSGVDAISLDNENNEIAKEWTLHCKVAAIGKTTANYLASNGYPVHHTAKAPNAYSLLEGILLIYSVS